MDWIGLEWINEVYLRNGKLMCLRNRRWEWQNVKVNSVNQIQNQIQIQIQQSASEL